MIDFIMLGGAKLKMEEEKKKKKAWTTPTLTPIVRREPEEGILVSCKGDGISILNDGCETKCCYDFWCEECFAYAPT